MNGAGLSEHRGGGRVVIGALGRAGLVAATPQVSQSSGVPLASELTSAPCRSSSAQVLGRPHVAA